MYVREAVLSDFAGALPQFAVLRSGARIYSVSRKRSILLHTHVLALRVPVLLKLEAWQMHIPSHAIF